jgi:hypothetical protein
MYPECIPNERTGIYKEHKSGRTFGEFRLQVLSGADVEPPRNKNFDVEMLWESRLM